MKTIIGEILSVFCVIDIFLSMFFIYKILKSLFKVHSFKGKLITIILSVCVMSLIYTEFEKAVPSIRKNDSMTKAIGIPIFVILFYALFHKYLKQKQYSISRLDVMEGHDFEHACADILKMNGYKNVRVTQASGDYGVDILAERKGIKYAVQCKRYSNKLDNTPIQEVVGGLAYYNCDKGIVMTNNYFTEPAKKLAYINDVKLIDRTVLEKMLIKKSKSNRSKEDREIKKISKEIDDMNRQLEEINNELDGIQSHIDFK